MTYTCAMDIVAPSIESPPPDCIQEELPEAEKERFSYLLREEEEKEEEPLLDGPVCAPLLFRNSLSASPVSFAIKPLPSWALKIASSLVEPLRNSIEKGITEIEWTIFSKELSTIHVLIEHYDTAPQSFNITLQGTEIAQRLFAKHQKSLERILKITFPAFECNLLRPTFAAKNLFKGGRNKKDLEKSKDFGYLPKLEEPSNDATY